MVLFSGYLVEKYHIRGLYLSHNLRSEWFDCVVIQAPKTALIPLPINENVLIRSIGCCSILNQLLWFRSITFAISAFQDAGSKHASYRRGWSGDIQLLKTEMPVAVFGYLFKKF